MRIYSCDHCNNLLYFENRVCLKCNHLLGFDSEKLDLVTLIPNPEDGSYKDVMNGGKHYRFCRNQEYEACNWLIPINAETEFCTACQLNRTIPFISDETLPRWRVIEVAKHRLVYSLLKLKLPIKRKTDDVQPGLAFDFLADISPENRVITGHSNGLITLNIEEADEAERVQNKLQMGEKYRTLLGHFRHEIGHYYWDLLIRDRPVLTKFRDLFGDETPDYGESLKVYYANGPRADWDTAFISPYATAHPWEDWAETWAHYFHLMDATETAFYFGIRVDPKKQTGVKTMDAEVNEDPYSINDFTKVFKMWLPLTFAVNSLNRAMGHNDFYPFVVAPKVIEKLAFIHNICRSEANVNARNAEQ